MKQGNKNCTLVCEFYEENLIDYDPNDMPFHIVQFDEKMQAISNNSLCRQRIMFMTNN